MFDAGWLDWQCLGRLGQLHCIAFACLRERVGCTGDIAWLCVALFNVNMFDRFLLNTNANDRRPWASGTPWGFRLMATCIPSSDVDPLSSSTAEFACWNIG